MKRNTLLIIFVLIGMSLSPVIAQIPAPNSSTQNGNTLSVDGFVTTKFASVGGDVEIFAHTKGHISSTQVTADILRYDMDPIDAINGELPLDGTIVSTVVLQNTGVHENDPTTMTWKGVYTIPVTSLGGMYGASIKAENSPTMIAVDDSTQITKLLFEKFENHVLKPLDTAWDNANPLGEIKSEFEQLESSGTSNGGWTNFVETATKGSGPGGSEQLWNNMIDAGRNNYDMEAGSNFLEALMEFLDSEDVDAGLMMITGLLLYGDEFPLPRVMEDFGEVIDYAQMFDPIENFTRFEGTGDFEAAYNALVGSNEWSSLQDSIDNLANNQLPFQSIQNILHNLALLAVSDHPDAVISALEAWIEPLENEDIDSMTPIQKLIVRIAEMNVDVQDLNGDEIPDDEGEITWEYELLLDTSEGQAWTAKMETNSPWVNDAFDNFNSLPENIVGHIFTSLESPVWEDLGESIEEFGQWIEQSSRAHYYNSWWNGEGQDDETIIFGDNCNDFDEEGEGEENNCTPEIKKIVTSIYDRNVLDLGVSLEINPEDWWTWEEHKEDVPNKFTIAMTNEFGDVESTDLVRDGNDFRYHGRLSVSTIEDAEWSFTQPLINFVPPCDECKVREASLEMEKLFPTLIESMAWENNDETFIVSAVGVLVTQDETTSVNSDYNVKATAYSHDGPVENAEIDLAVLRISPQVAEDAAGNLDIEGEVQIQEYDNGNPELIIGTYSADDINGNLEVEINPRGYLDGEDRYLYDQLSFQNSFQNEGDSNGWTVDISSANGNIGIAEITTTGKTNSGISFERTEQFPVHGTPDCMFTQGNVEDMIEEGGQTQDRINLELRVQEWDGPSYEYNTPEIVEIHIDWGDGTDTHIGGDETIPSNYWGWEEHVYYDAEGTEFDISIEYIDENSNTYFHYFTYLGREGFERTDENHEHDDEETGEDEDHTWYSWDIQSFEWGQWQYCQLNSWYTTTPSPAIIDSFITDGPFEVMKEEIMTSNSDGDAVMSVTPTLPGAYISIAQAKVTRADGKEMVGIGMNLAGVTEGSITIGGDLNQETTFGGLPVYISERADLSTGISIAPTDIPCDEGHTIFAGLVPLDLRDAFPDVPHDEWTGDDGDDDEMSTELEFSCSDSAKNWEVELKAPMYLFAALAMDSSNNEDDEDDEDDWDDEDDSSEQLFPNALHIGIILNNPASLKLTGDLGPGQTTNIALSDEDGPASRILAVATPKEGFDPATIDFSAFTEFIYGEGVRNEVGWVAQEEEINKVRIVSDAWCEDRNDYDWDTDTSYGESNIRTRINVDMSRWSSETPPNPADTYLKDSEGNIISPVRDWYQEWEGDDQWYANYKIEDAGDFELILDEHVNQMYIDIGPDFNGVNDFCNDVGDSWHETDGGNEINTPEEIFELIDSLLSNIDSIAWGQGSSADLQLPILSSPVGEYTILSIAQIGEGDSATIVSAINNEVIIAEPNPEPPEVSNIFLSFSPADPKIGDIITINVVDESNAPVDGLSVTGKKDGAWTIFSMVTNDAGQAEFIAQEGTIDILVSGGNYNPAELTIIVSPTGITTDDGGDLPDEDNPLQSNDDDSNIDSNDDLNDDSNIDSNEEESGSGTGLSSTLGEYQNIFLIIIGVLVVVIVLLLSVMKLRGREDDDWADDAAWDDYEEIVKTPASYNSAPPSSQSRTPPNYLEGQWRDGYEVLEYPSGSGSWWYKDGNTGQWMEWK